MKIGLFSAHSFKRPGGVQNHVLALYREFTKRRIECKIITPGPAKPYGVPETDIITIGVSTYLPANKSRAEFSVSVRRSFRRKLHAEKFDVLHFHNLGFGPLAYQILRSAESLNILTLHAAIDGSMVVRVPSVKKIVHNLYEPKFHGVITISPAALETLNMLGGFSNGPIATIANGIDLSRFSPRKNLKSREMTNLLFVGRFEKRKGLLHLLRAFRHLTTQSHRSNLRLVIVGDGEQFKAAQNFTSKNNLSSYITFAGNISDDALPAFYQVADIFCAPSLCGESFGMTLLEAMACGTPIAGFANPGYSFVMQGHEKACGANLLAPAGDAIALAQKIALLIENKDVYERAKSWGLTRVQKFAWSKIADQVLNFYEETDEWRKNKAIVMNKM